MKNKKSLSKARNVILLIGIVFTLVTLTLIIAPSLDLGAIKEKNNTTETFTPTSKTSCIDNLCTFTTGGDNLYVQEDNTWKKYTDARSLKNSSLFEVRYLEVDKDIKLEIIDFNSTSIIVKPTTTDTKATIIPVKVWETNTTKPTEILTGDFKLDMIKAIDTSIPLKDFNKEQTYNFGMDKVLEFGDNSTTIVLQTANSSNMADSYVDLNAPDTNYGYGEGLLALDYAFTGYDRNIYLRFNITNVVPAGNTVIHANLSLNLFSNLLDGATEGFNLSAYLVYYNQSWTETGITWNNAPTISNGGVYPIGYGSNRYFGGTGEPTGWQEWDVTSMIEANKDKNNVSIALLITGLFGSVANNDNLNFRSKEYGTADVRPKLTIIYDTTPVGDNEYPQFSDYYDDNATLQETGTGNFNVTVLNTNGTVILHINNTDILATNLTADVYNVSFAFTSAGVYSYNWTAYGNGTAHNFNTSENRYYTVNVTPDLIFPTFSSFGESIANGSSYIYNQPYDFNLTIIDTNGTAGISFNDVNYSLSNISSSFNKTFSNLDAGTYPYYYWARGNGTQKNYNQSDTFYYTIIQANSTEGLNITGTTPITYPTITDVAYSENNSGDTGCSYSLSPSNGVKGVGVTLFNYSTDGCTNYLAGSKTLEITVEQNTTWIIGITGTTPIVYGTTTDVAGTNCPAELTCSLDKSNIVYGVGTETFNYSTAGNTNYSANSITKDIVITQATSTLTLKINDTEANQTAVYGTQTNVSVVLGNSEQETILYQNGVDITSSNNIFRTLGVDDYNFTAIAPATQNYTALTITRWSHISPVILNLSIVVKPSHSILNETPSNVSGYGCPSQLTCDLHRNNVVVSNSDIATLEVGIYNYIFNTTGNQNYTGANVSDVLLVYNHEGLIIDFFINYTLNAIGSAECSNGGYTLWGWIKNLTGTTYAWNVSVCNGLNGTITDINCTSGFIYAVVNGTGYCRNETDPLFAAENSSLWVEALNKFNATYNSMIIYAYNESDFIVSTYNASWASTYNESYAIYSYNWTTATYNLYGFWWFNQTNDSIQWVTNQHYLTNESDPLWSLNWSNMQGNCTDNYWQAGFYDNATILCLPVPITSISSSGTTYVASELLSAYDINPQEATKTAIKGLVSDFFRRYKLFLVLFTLLVVMFIADRKMLWNKILNKFNSIEKK